MTKRHALTAYRQANDLTLEAFGALVDATKGTVSKWEHGALPRRRHLERIAMVTRGAVQANDFVQHVSAPAHRSDCPVS